MSARSPNPHSAARSSSALEHPLPAGMRDLMPVEARTLSALGRRLSSCFELHGYQRVTVPAFEYAEVLERGLGELDPREVLRFVEPETGEVVALRPDMTPQIARLVATRLRSAPGPARLCYEGSIVRLRRERARRHRQIPQAGIELVGAPAAVGDDEVLAVASAAVRTAGLRDFVLDLGHARVAGALLELVPAEHRPRLMEALAVKDPVELDRRAAAAGVDVAVARPLTALCELHGGAEVWGRAERSLAGSVAEPALAELRRVWEVASEQQLAPVVSVDLGEVRDLSYYTGVTFQLLAEGPGEPIAAGGRYDGLLRKFGADRPAAGFAIALDDLLWALGSSDDDAPPRVLVSGSGGELSAVLSAIRTQGIVAAHVEADVDAHARAWGYSHVVSQLSSHRELVQLTSGERYELPAGDPQRVGREIARLVRETTSRAAGGQRPRSENEP